MLNNLFKNDNINVAKSIKLLHNLGFVSTNEPIDNDFNCENFSKTLYLSIDVQIQKQLHAVLDQTTSGKKVVLQLVQKLKKGTGNQIFQYTEDQKTINADDILHIEKIWSHIIHYSLNDIHILDDIIEFDCLDRTCLYYACLNGNLFVVDYLVNTHLQCIGYPSNCAFEVQVSEPVDQVNKLGETPLHVACMYGFDNIANCLISQLKLHKKENMLDHMNENKETPLFYAIFGNHLEIVKMLVDANCNVNVQNIWGLTPLHVAVSMKFVDIVNYLLDLPNIDLNQIENYGNTPLALALMYEDQRLINLFLKRILHPLGEDVDGIDTIVNANEKTIINS